MTNEKVKTGEEEIGGTIMAHRLINTCNSVPYENPRGNRWFVIGKLGQREIDSSSNGHRKFYLDVIFW